MERRWLGWADKSGPGPAWTSRIRGDLRSWEIFRWTDVWRGQDRGAESTGARRPFPAGQRRSGCKSQTSLAKGPARVPKTRGRSALTAGGKDGAWRRPTVEMNRQSFMSCVSSAFFSPTPGNHIPPAAPRLIKAQRCCWSICNFSPSHFMHR